MSKNIYSFFIAILFIFLHNSLISQSSGPFPYDLKKMFNGEKVSLIQNSDKDFLRTWQEHIVLHTDRNEFVGDQSLFFKAFILTGPDRVRATLSKVLRLDLLDKNDLVVSTQYHRILEGMAQGSISAPRKMEDGNYTLRAYTQWMKNYGDDGYSEKEIIYQNKNRNKNAGKEENQPLNVAFYPEGGRLVENLDNRLLIKTTDTDGEGLNMEGEIIDETGAVSIPVKNYDDGVSSLRFVPKANKKYFFRAQNGETFVLPKVEEDGFVIHVSTLNSGSLAVRIQTSKQLLGTKIFLRGVMNSVPYFEKELDVKDTNLTLDIPKKGIPAGVLEIQLVDEDDTLIATRPVEIGLEHLNITIAPTEGANPNAYVVKVQDPEGRPVETVVSLSISHIEGTEDTFSKKLISDGWRSGTGMLTGDNKGRATLYKKDLEVMTSYGDLVEDRVKELPDTIMYPFQRGLNLYGFAYNLNDELLTNTDIQIFGVSGSGVFTKEVKTDASGLLKLENLQFEGETELVFRTSGDDTKSRLVNFQPKEQTLSKIDKEMVDGLKEKGQPTKNGDVVQSSSWEPVDPDRLIELEEVSVIDKKQQKRKTAPSVYGITPTKVKYQDFERPQTIPQLFLGIPGVQVQGIGTFEPTIFLPKSAGLGPVLWVLDGMPLVQPTKLSEIISMVSYVDVDKIEILYGAQASIYGTRAAGGAILIYTRSGSFLDSYNRKDANIKFQGYHESLNFENYLEDLEKKSIRHQNNLSTLYWNPNLKTNKNGEALVELKVPVEKDSPLKLEATAVTENGELGSLKVIY